jgi:hypothetical protein
MARAKKTRSGSARRGEKTTSKRAASPARSRKAPAPPAPAGSMKPQAKRRQPSAVAAVRKDSMILQTNEGPRAAWSASKPMFQKR